MSAASKKAFQIKATDEQGGRAPSYFSSTLWGIDWSRYFPTPFGKVTAELASFAEIAAFSKKHFPEIYHHTPGTQRFADTAAAAVRERYYKIAGDFFAFRDGGVLVGVAVGSPLDWSGYNFRNVSLLPSHHGQGIYQEFFPFLAEILRSHGVERLEGDVAPSNQPHIHALTKMGAVVTGLNLSDRWGAVLHFTKYLLDGPQEVFHDQFCQSVHELKLRRSQQE